MLSISNKRLFGAIIPVALGLISLVAGVARADTSAPGSLFEEDQAETKRFIQWPRVTIGLVWTDTSTGQMRMMDLGGAPEEGRFTRDIIESRCMRAASRLSPDGLDATTGDVYNLRPMTDSEVMSLITDISTRAPGR